MDSFEAWMNEIENYSSRRERFYEDILTVLYNPHRSANVHYDRMTAWLRAAYEEGANSVVKKQQSK